MNIQEYISSGVIELYALGALSPEEAREVEAKAEKYPEVRAELDAVSASLEGYATAHSQAPPPGLKARILDQIEEGEKEVVSAAPSPVSFSKATKAAQAPKLKYYKLAVAASLTLFLASVIYLAMQMQQLDESETKLAAMEKRLSALTESNDLLAERLDSIEAEGEWYQRNQFFELTGGDFIEPVGDDPSVLLAVDPRNGDIYVLVNELSPPPEDMKYVLWTILEGVDAPVNVGYFELGGVAKKISTGGTPTKINAFAISQEKDVTTQTPTKVIGIKSL